MLTIDALDMPRSILVFTGRYHIIFNASIVNSLIIFHGCKNVNFQIKNYDIFLFFAQNIDCGYTLEPPHGGCSNGYPQSMFFEQKIRKKRIPLYTPDFLYKSGV